MPRKKKIKKDETLSQETKQVQETLLKDLVEEPKKIEKKIEEPKKVEEPKRIEIKEISRPKVNELKVGDIVRLKSNVETDTLGRRIHNGIRNYTYRVLAVRPDGFISIECLTYCFLVRKDQVDKI